MKKTKKNVQRGGDVPKIIDAGPLKPSDIKKMQKTQKINLTKQINPTKKNKPVWATQNEPKIIVQQPMTKKKFGSTFEPKNYETIQEIKKPLSLEEIIGRLNRYNSEAQKHIPLKSTQIKSRKIISSLTNKNVSHIYGQKSNAERQQALRNTVGSDLAPHFKKLIFGGPGERRDPENQVQKTIRQLKILHDITPSQTAVSEIVRTIQGKSNPPVSNVLPRVASVASVAPATEVAPVLPRKPTPPANKVAPPVTEVAPPANEVAPPANKVDPLVPAKASLYLNISPLKSEYTSYSGNTYNSLTPSTPSTESTESTLYNKLNPITRIKSGNPDNKQPTDVVYYSSPNSGSGSEYNVMPPIVNIPPPYYNTVDKSGEYIELNTETTKQPEHYYSTIPETQKHEYSTLLPTKTFFDYISGNEQVANSLNKNKVAEKRELKFLGMRPEDFKNKLLLEYTFGTKPENYFSNLGNKELQEKIIEKQAEIQKKYKISNEKLEEMRGNIEATSEALRLSDLKSGSLKNLSDNKILNETLKEKHKDFVDIKKTIDRRIKRKAKEEKAQALNKISKPPKLLNSMSEDINKQLLNKQLLNKQSSKIKPKTAYKFAKKYVKKLLNNKGNEEVKNLYKTYKTKEVKEKLIFKYLQKLQELINKT